MDAFPAAARKATAVPFVPGGRPRNRVDIDCFACAKSDNSDLDKVEKSFTSVAMIGSP
jgi:hypothetical protein